MGLLDGARAHVQSVCRELFERVRAGASPAVSDLVRLRLSYVTATEQLLHGIELIRRAAGMNSLQTGSPIERCWRDLNAVGQHFALGTAHDERIGEMASGPSGRRCTAAGRPAARCVAPRDLLTFRAHFAHREHPDRRS